MKSPKDSTSSLSKVSFPSTSLHLLKRVQEEKHKESMEELCRRYWKPVYSYVRSFRKCPREEARDLTQDFFIEIFDGKLVERYTPANGSFRGFLRGCLRVFVLHFRRKAGAQKRGGHLKLVSFSDEDLSRLDDLAAPADETPEKRFDRQWARDVLDAAVAALRAELRRAKKDVPLKVFDRYGDAATADETLTYASLARELGIKETDISNHLTSTRKRLRELILERIREYQTGESEVGAEFVALFSS